MHATRKRHVDWIALALFVSLVFIGWLMIFAAGYDQQGSEPESRDRQKCPNCGDLPPENESSANVSV